MPDCPTGNLTARVCDLETAIAEVLLTVGHPPFTLTYSGASFSFDEELQTGNIPLPPEAPSSTPDTAVWADNAARALLAPLSLNQIGIQTTDATNGNFSFWAPTGLVAGNWTLKVGSLGGQNANNVSVTGGSITGITDLLVVDGGTGASTVAGAVYNLYNPTAAPAASVINWALSNNFAETISANTVYTFSNEKDGASITVAVLSTGAYTVTFPAGVQWAGGTAPVATASSTDVFTFIRINGVIYGSVIQDFS